MSQVDSVTLGEEASVGIINNLSYGGLQPELRGLVHNVSYEP